MSQASHPTFINLPPPGSNPDTPSEMPGTPTSTTTSLSALSTTAIKDGHRGQFASGPLGRGHQHNPSTTSLEAERADRISRLAGLERVSTLRATPGTAASAAMGGGPSSISPQTTPTSTTGGVFPPNFPTAHNLTPSYFDSNGQPVADTKMSTVGSASATESQIGGGSRTTAGEVEEDLFSTDTNYREAGSVVSAGAFPDAMDEDVANQSTGGFEDRMSDDGSASLVGFGEGAGSTVSGPIYHRRPPPGAFAAQSAWNLERTSSGMSDSRRDRDIQMSGGETPTVTSALNDRRDQKWMEGVHSENSHHGMIAEQDHSNNNTMFRGPSMTGIEEREAAENIVQRLDHGENRAGATGLSSPGAGGQALGRFYFEGDRRKD